MTVNEMRGEGVVRIGDVDYTLKFTWTAIRALDQKYGTKGFNLLDPDVLADIVVIGVSHKHPEVTKEMVLDASPPLVPTVNAVQEAINLAYHGTREVPKPDENPLEMVKRMMTPPTKKTPSGKRGARQSSADSPPISSGE